MDRIIKIKKGIHRNIFHNNISGTEWFDICVFLIGSSVVSEFFCSIFDNSIISTAVLFMTYIFIILVRNKFRKDNQILPYKKTEQFVGLYSIEGSKPISANFDNGLITRKTEIKYIKRILDVILEQSEVKQGMCLVGKSGCGKSTILNLFENADDNPYTILNFSEKYEFLDDYIKYEFDDDYVGEIRKSNKKFIIIFDQFERFFSLNELRQKQVKKIIKEIAIKNVAIVFSLREEFFLQFLNFFDINNLNEKDIENFDYHGIISSKKHLISNKTEMDNILLCLNDETYKNTNKSSIDTNMQRLCEQAFGDRNWRIIYDKFKNGTLIQQQIVFNMLKNEKNYNHDFIKYLDTDENYMMKRYFDVQLCSTGDFFNSSRIMYLLSLGRNKNVSLNNDDIKDALCVFGKFELAEFKMSLKKLHELQLIKETKYNSTENYEVAHDYIAKAFETYANTEMPTNVKVAIDEYLAEHTRQTSISNNIRKYREKRKKTSATWFILIFSFILSILAYGIFREIYNKDISWTILALALASLFYVFNFYINISRYYLKKNKILIALCYILSMLCGILSVIFSDFWLQCLGAGNFLLGISCIIVGLSKEISSIGREMFFSYGVKTALVGGLLLGYAFFIKMGVFEEILNINIRMILEIMPMAALLGYAYFAHLNKEFFYSHLEAILSTNE